MACLPCFGPVQWFALHQKRIGGLRPNSVRLWQAQIKAGYLLKLFISTSHSTQLTDISHSTLAMFISKIAWPNEPYSWTIKKNPAQQYTNADEVVTQSDLRKLRLTTWMSWWLLPWITAYWNLCIGTIGWLSGKLKLFARWVWGRYTWFIAVCHLLQPDDASHHWILFLNSGFMWQW